MGDKTGRGDRVIDIRNAFKSALFFSQLLFFKREYDVIFIYRNTFIRRGGINHLLEPFVESCKKHGLSYLLLESRHYQKRSGYRYLESSEAVPYNLITFLRIKLRKLYKAEGADSEIGSPWIEREEKIAKVLQRLFFGNLKTRLFVTLVGNNNVAFLKSIYPDTAFAEYQHGIFWCQYDFDTLALRNHQRNTQNRDTTLLLYGEGFADVYAQCPRAMAYPSSNIKVIGSSLPVPEYRSRQNRKTILYTLQNVDMQSNESYYRMIRSLIAVNAEYLERNGYSILFKNHPRYEREDALVFEEAYPFISFAGDDTSMDLLDDVCIHITSKSTTALDTALHSIPTIFIDMLELRSPRVIFFDQYRYPLNDFIIKLPSSLKGLLQSLDDPDYYSECSRQVFEWARYYYQDFNEEVFLDLLAD